MVRAKRPDPELIDAENPELTDEFFKKARRLPDMPEVVRRAVGQRGPQKEPVKQRITIRLDSDIVERYKASGQGWQTRINDDLRKVSSRRRIA